MNRLASEWGNRKDDRQVNGPLIKKEEREG